jgi:hypothetical protein
MPVERAELIARQQAVLAAGYKADPDNGRRLFDPGLLRRYTPENYQPADAVYFCPGCRGEWNRGIQKHYAGYWSWGAGADERVGRKALLDSMRQHEQYRGEKHRMRIVEEPEGVPVPEDGDA